MHSARRLVFLVFLVTVLGCSGCRAQLTFNVLLRVLMIQTLTGQGTGFTVDVDGRQCLITAKHIVAGLKPEDTVQIWKYDKSHKPKWVSIKVKIFMCDDPIDIAVLIPPEQLTVSFPLEPTREGMMYGQDAFFLGFPLGMYSDVKTSFELPYPLAFVKKGVISAEQDEGNVRRIILDGFNIFGFSGSPVVFRNLNRGNEFGYNVLGVVSSFTSDDGPVLVPKEIRQQDVTREDVARGRIRKKEGKVYRLEETPNHETVILNTGIVTSFGIEHAVDLIRLHPLGPRTVDDFRPALAE